MLGCPYCEIGSHLDAMDYMLLMSSLVFVWEVEVLVVVVVVFFFWRDR